MMGDEIVTWGPFRGRLAIGWVSTAVPSGLLIAPLAVMEDARAWWPATSVLLQEVGMGELDTIVSALMKRRVGRGEPEVSDSNRFGLQTRCHAWTDGVSWLRAWFVPVGQRVFEIQLSAPLIPGPLESPSFADELERVADSITIQAPIPG